MLVCFFPFFFFLIFLSKQACILFLWNLCYKTSIWKTGSAVLVNLIILFLEAFGQEEEKQNFRQCGRATKRSRFCSLIPPPHLDICYLKSIV